MELWSAPPGYSRQAALRALPIDPVLAAWSNSPSSSPARTAVIRVSITAGSLSLDGTTMPALPFSNSRGLAPNLMDIGLPPGSDGLLLGDGLPLAVHLGPSLDGPDVVGILQEQLLLLQLRDELGPARLDGIVAVLGKRGERE
jgi:hypothetical protein